MSLKPIIAWSDFEKLDLRVGTITEVENFPEARRPAFKLKIDFGPDLGVLKSSAQITDRYDRKSLMGRQIVAVVNFPPKQIATFMSECLVLGALASDGVVLLRPEGPGGPVEPGLPVA